MATPKMIMAARPSPDILAMALPVLAWRDDRRLVWPPAAIVRKRKGRKEGIRSGLLIVDVVLRDDVRWVMMGGRR